MKITRLLGLLFICQLSLAQAQQPVDSTSLVELNEIVVTGTRSAIDREKVPQRIEVINAKDIQLTPYQEFTDILKKNSSVNIIQYPGLLAGVGIRGFRPQTGGINQRALLLIDGRPAGTTNLATIDPSSIERVEVLKGPASALYGSQAMGGVVNVITKRSQGAVQSSLLAEYGSFNTFRIGAQTGGNITDKLDFDLSFTSFNRNDDFKLGKDNVFRNLLNADKATKFYSNAPSQDVDDSRGDGEHRDFTRLSYHSGALRIGYQLTDTWRVDVRGERFVARNVESPSDIAVGNASPSSKDMERSNGEVRVSGNFANHQLLIKGFAAEEDGDSYTLTDYLNNRIPPYRSFWSKTAWTGVQVRDVFNLGQHSITAGLDYNHVSTQSRAFNNDTTERAPYSPNSALISTGIYLQGQLNFLNERLIIYPGARLDLITFDVKSTPLMTTYNPGRESNPFFSPSLGAQYQVMESLRVHGTIGRAFVTPDAYNVAGYSQSGRNKAVAITRGNPDLRNENSITWDAGIRFNQPAIGLSADITYFSTNVKDRITSQTTQLSSLEFTASGDTIKSTTTYVNANKGVIQGLEAEVGYDFGALSDYAYSLRVFANATSILKAEEITVNRDGSERRRDIYNVANFTTAYGVEYANQNGLNVRLSGRYVGNRRDTDFNDPLYPEIRYPAFMVLDLAASYTYARKHTLSLLVNNITNENYYEKRGYNLPGRNFTIRYGLTF